MVMSFLVYRNRFSRARVCCRYIWWIRTKLTWSESTKALTWFEAKGKMEQIFKQLNLSINWKICFL
jgi:hypothetical protein